MGRRRQSLAERLWTMVAVRGKNECWPWHGGVSKSGYAYVSVPRDTTEITVRPGRGRHVMVPAGRVVYQLVAGPLPVDVDLILDCGNRRCVNPYHNHPRDAVP